MLKHQEKVDAVFSVIKFLDELVGQDKAKQAAIFSGAMLQVLSCLDEDLAYKHFNASIESMGKSLVKYYRDREIV